MDKELERKAVEQRYARDYFDGIVSEQTCAALHTLAGAIHANNVAKGFWDEPEHVLACRRLLDATNDSLTFQTCQAVIDSYERNKGEALMLVVSEAAECLEAIRAKTEDGKPLMDDHVPELTGEAAEIADIIIRCLDYCAGYDINIGEAIHKKMRYNVSRPPKHGKKF